MCTRQCTRMQNKQCSVCIWSQNVQTALHNANAHQMHNFPKPTVENMPCRRRRRRRRRVAWLRRALAYNMRAVAAWTALENTHTQANYVASASTIPCSIVLVRRRCALECLRMYLYVFSAQESLRTRRALPRDKHRAQHYTHAWWWRWKEW